MAIAEPEIAADSEVYQPVVFTQILVFMNVDSAGPEMKENWRLARRRRVLQLTRPRGGQSGVHGCCDAFFSSQW